MAKGKRKSYTEKFEQVYAQFKKEKPSNEVIEIVNRIFNGLTIDAQAYNQSAWATEQEYLHRQAEVKAATERKLAALREQEEKLKALLANA
jgi:hypothetical protein